MNLPELEYIDRQLAYWQSTVAAKSQASDFHHEAMRKAIAAADWREAGKHAIRGERAGELRAAGENCIDNLRRKRSRLLMSASKAELAEAIVQLQNDLQEIAQALAALEVKVWR